MCLKYFGGIQLMVVDLAVQLSLSITVYVAATQRHDMYKLQHCSCILEPWAIYLVGQHDAQVVWVPLDGRGRSVCRANFSCALILACRSPRAGNGASKELHDLVRGMRVCVTEGCANVYASIFAGGFSPSLFRAYGHCGNATHFTPQVWQPCMTFIHGAPQGRALSSHSCLQSCGTPEYGRSIFHCHVLATFFDDSGIRVGMLATRYSRGKGPWTIHLKRWLGGAACQWKADGGAHPAAPGLTD